MGQPKKRTSSRRRGARRSHLVLKLAHRVNATSPVKAYTTRRHDGKPASAKSPSKARTSSATAGK